MATADRIATLFADEFSFWTDDERHIGELCDHLAHKVLWSNDRDDHWIAAFGDGSAIMSTPEFWGVVAYRDGDWVVHGEVIGTVQGSTLTGWHE